VLCSGQVCEEMHLYRINNALDFETILHFDCCCLYCGCWNIPIDNKGRISVKICICFLWEKKWYDHAYEGRLIVETSTDILQGPKSKTSFLYKCDERQKTMAWETFYLSNSWGQKNRLEMLPVFRMGVQGPLCQDNSYKMQQLPRTIIIETNFIHISVVNYILLSTFFF
jgi:hypothetical protein